jgi:hypothetical protein
MSLVLNTKIKQVQNVDGKIRTILIGKIQTHTASLHEVTTLKLGYMLEFRPLIKVE